MSRLHYPVLTLRRRDLVAAGACKKWLAQFDAICALRGPDTAPSVRRKDGTSYRDPARLRIELTPLAQVWAARDAREAVEWLRMKGLWYGADLCGANLRGADLRGADLRGADLRGANLRGADLRGANLRGADLYGADLCGANLRGADLYGADLYGANLHGADLYGADLRGANMYGADLHGANLYGADLRGANLHGANLRGANRASFDPAIPGWRLVAGNVLDREVSL